MLSRATLALTIVLTTVLTTVSVTQLQRTSRLSGVIGGCIQWTGAGATSDWHDTNNWSSAHAPGSPGHESDCVEINTGSKDIDLKWAITLSNLTIGPSWTGTLAQADGESNLDVTDTYEHKSGTFTGGGPFNVEHMKVLGGAFNPVTGGWFHSYFQDGGTFAGGDTVTIESTFHLAGGTFDDPLILEFVGNGSFQVDGGAFYHGTDLVVLPDGSHGLGCDFEIKSHTNFYGLEMVNAGGCTLTLPADGTVSTSIVAAFSGTDSNPLTIKSSGALPDLSQAGVPAGFDFFPQTLQHVVASNVSSPGATVTCTDCTCHETNWNCTGSAGDGGGGGGNAECGNGEVEGGEECDYGDPDLPDDGCSSECKADDGWTCTGTPPVCTPDDIDCLDLSNASFSASGQYDLVEKIADLNMCTRWNAGSVAGWAEVDLGSAQTFANFSIRPEVAPSPAHVTYKIYAGNSPNPGGTPVTTFSGPVRNGRWLYKEFPAVTARYIRIEGSQGGWPGSWIAIKEMNQCGNFISVCTGCGNHQKEGSEECDDGNLTNGDGCSATCTNEGGAICGDGEVEGSEQCDDGNAVNTDACTNSCKNAVCGDGYVHASVEACDDGNTANNDGCSSTCTVESGYKCTDSPDSRAHGLSVGAAGTNSLWFAQPYGNRIGKILTDGTITHYDLPTPDSYPGDMILGPDNNIWFSQHDAHQIGRIAMDGTISEFPITTPNGGPRGVAVGPDGNIWFIEQDANKIGKMSTAGQMLAEYPVATSQWDYRITAGPDGNLWFTDAHPGKVWKITTSGVATAYALSVWNAYPSGITSMGGNLWFTQQGNHKIGKATPSGTITEAYTVPTPNSVPADIAPDASGNLWFTEHAVSKIGKISPNGTIQEYAVPTTDSRLGRIVLGPDGNMWFTQWGVGKIGKITPSGVITEYEITEPSICTPDGGGADCGNGIIEGTEQCDDNNTVSGDGCSATCQIETGWKCTGQPSVCSKCGNSVKERPEECDDGNTVNGDGCSELCKKESSGNGGCFESEDAWTVFDADAALSSPNRGYTQIASDGRHLYFAPFHHKEILRYDTQGNFESASAWETYAPTKVTQDLYTGIISDGRYVYFEPWDHGEFLRYDNTGGFANENSWSVFNPTDEGVGPNLVGFHGITFDGQYVYFAPQNDGTGQHGRVVRYNTQGSFEDKNSWSYYDVSAKSVGFSGAEFDGRYVYFVPRRDAVGHHGRIVRYDTQQGFSDPNAWEVFDAGVVSPKTKGMNGAAYDGQYMYFGPYNIGAWGVPANLQSEVLRYDTDKPFVNNNNNSWDSYETQANGIGNPPGGLGGVVFDGRYIYLPQNYHVAGDPYDGEIVRYDTDNPFASKDSWSAYDPGNNGVGINPRAFAKPVFDGRYVYFPPYDGASGYTAEILRYDTEATCSGGAVCGNNAIDGTDACDGTDLGGQTCASQGFDSGTLACTSDCFFDTSNCTANVTHIACEEYPRTGSEKVWIDNHPQYAHVIMKEHRCEVKPGAGANQCSMSFNPLHGDCQPVHHLKCIDDMCVPVLGPGSNVCVGEFTSCSSPPICGNGSAEGTEDCDGADLNGETCVTQGFQGGTLACANTCAFDLSGCTAPPNCGNDEIDAGEQCDGSNLNGETCASNGFDGGTLSCNANCSLNTTQCHKCGDGIVNGAEECDGGACCTSGNADPAENCKFKLRGTECRAVAAEDRCDTAEFCTGFDGECPADKYLASGTVCRQNDDALFAALCDPEETCTGNSKTCPADKRKASTLLWYCPMRPLELQSVGIHEEQEELICGLCSYDSCRDGCRQPWEECDDGDYKNTNTCTNDCTVPRCGDGYVFKEIPEKKDEDEDSEAGEGGGEGDDEGGGNEGIEGEPGAEEEDECPLHGTYLGGELNWEELKEECDDGNDSNADYCITGCKTYTCGDGYVNKGVEVCDPGKQCVDGSSCTSEDDCSSFGDKRCIPRVSAELSAQNTCPDGSSCTKDSDCTGPCKPEKDKCKENCETGDEECLDQCDEDEQKCLEQSVCTYRDGWTCLDGTKCTSENECQHLGNTACQPRRGNGCGGNQCTAPEHCCASMEHGWECWVEGTMEGEADTGKGICTPVYGDGIVVGPEQCDDGSRCNYDFTADGYEWYTAVRSAVETENSLGIPWSKISGTRKHQGKRCGDPSYCPPLVRIETTEERDEETGELLKLVDKVIREPNPIPENRCAPLGDDGCSATGVIENGWTCKNFDGHPSRCTPICGDGIAVPLNRDESYWEWLESYETCDDGMHCSDTPHVRNSPPNVSPPEPSRTQCTADAKCKNLDLCLEAEVGNCHKTTWRTCRSQDDCPDDDAFSCQPDADNCPKERCEKKSYCSDGRTQCFTGNDCQAFWPDDDECRPRDGDACPSNCGIPGSSLLE